MCRGILPIILPKNISTTSLTDACHRLSSTLCSCRMPVAAGREYHQAQLPVWVSGRVVDKLGKAVAGAWVELSYMYGGQNGTVDIPREFSKFFHVRTDRTGHWKINGLPGRCHAVFNLADPTFLFQRVVTRLEPGHAQAPMLVARKGATLTGRVLTAAVNPPAKYLWSFR